MHLTPGAYKRLFCPSPSSSSSSLVFNYVGDDRPQLAATPNGSAESANTYASLRSRRVRRARRACKRVHAADVVRNTEYSAACACKWPANKHVRYRCIHARLNVLVVRPRAHTQPSRPRPPAGELNNISTVIVSTGNNTVSPWERYSWRNN